MVQLKEQHQKHVEEMVTQLRVRHQMPEQNQKKLEEIYSKEIITKPHKPRDSADEHITLKMSSFSQYKFISWFSLGFILFFVGIRCVLQ